MDDRRRARPSRTSAAVAAAVLILGGCSGPGAAARATTDPTPTPRSSRPAPIAASSTTSAPPPGGVDPAALDRALADLVAMPGGPPGVIAVVQVGDDRTVHTAGVADLATGAAPGVGDHMRVASTAKAFSGAVALALVDQGVLSPDDTIGRWVPALPATWAGVTLRQLLSHTSGLPDFTRNQAFREALAGALTTAPPPSEMLAFVADEPLGFPPGSQYSYDNTDNIVVGLMIEAATGLPYARVLQEQVLDPLGLTDTSLPVGVEIPEPVFRGYDLDPPDAPEDVTQLVAAGWSWASGGIVSTPADLTTFVRAYVGGDLFGPRTQALHEEGFSPGGESGPPGPGLNSAGLALFRYETPCGTVLGHTGNTAGYTQFAAADPGGTRSVTVSVSTALSSRGSPDQLLVLGALQRAEEQAVCLALAGS